MRVISGIRKGIKLIGSKNLIVRPTTDSTKEFIFNYLGERIVEAKILDLFSGTGNLGIEAISRGASEVIFVERNNDISKIIYKNLKLTQFESQARIIISDVFRYLKRIVKKNLKFDLIFADPPYYSNLYFKLINEIDKNNILQNNGIFIIEHKSKEKISNNLTNITLRKEKILGNTTISFFVNIRG